MRQLLFAVLLVAVSPFVHGGVTAKDAWVRGTVPGQTTTGAFVTLTSTEQAKVVAASSPVARQVEIHASMMMGGVMHMHAIDAIELLPGRPVELKPGGNHVMLMGLTKPMNVGDKVPIAFTIVDAKGKRSTFEVKAEVRPISAR